MANSGVNPLIYAWKNSAFRRAFGKLLRCQKPDGGGADQEQIESMRSAAARKSSSVMHRQDTFNSTKTDFSTPPSSARQRTNSSDSASDIAGIGMGGYGGGGGGGIGIHGQHRGSITDSGVVVVMKHKRLSSLSSEHRYSQTTISEETISNHTTVVMFSSQEVESSDVESTPRKEVPQPPPTRNTNAKLIRNKCAILESFDSVSDESSKYSPDLPDPPQKNSIFNFKHAFTTTLKSSSVDLPEAIIQPQPKNKHQMMANTMACRVNENFETVVCKL